MSLRAVLNFRLVPSNVLFLLGLLGFLAMLADRRRIARVLTGLSAAGFAVFGFTSAGELLMAPLDTRFPAVDPASAEKPFGIIVLGGHVDESMAHAKGSLVEFHDGAESVAVTAILAQRYPQARVVLSGSSGSQSAPLRAVDGMRRILMLYGVADERIVLGPQSRSTFEHVRIIIELVGADADEVWWRVTQSHRMPRTVGVFRELGFEPVPFPVDFRWQARLIPCIFTV